MSLSNGRGFVLIGWELIWQPKDLVANINYLINSNITANAITFAAQLYKVVQLKLVVINYKFWHGGQVFWDVY